MFSEIRFALRQLRKNPGVTAVAIAALALGIGANTAIFSLINTLFLQPLPYPHPEELVQLTSTDTAKKLERVGFSHPRYLSMRESQQVFTDMAFAFGSPFTVTSTGRPAAGAGHDGDGEFPAGARHSAAAWSRFFGRGGHSPAARMS